MFKFQSPSKSLQLIQYTYGDIFSTAQNSFELVNFDATCSASAVVCVCVCVCVLNFTSSTSPKCFPWRASFIWGSKKCCWGQDWVNRQGGAWGSSHF